MFSRLSFVLAVTSTVVIAQWEALDPILDSGITERIFPGCVAAVFTKNTVPYITARGKFTYGIPPPETPGFVPPMTRGTIFDMASCTKVVAGTSAIALLYQRGLLALDDKVSKFISGFESHEKQAITVLHLLLHNAGFPPDPVPNYDTIKFGCPETSKFHPEEVFTCRAKCYQALIDQTLSGSVGKEYVYSDISFMAIMDIVGHVAREAGLVGPADVLDVCPLGDKGEDQCWYEAFVRKFVVKPLRLAGTMYLPQKQLWKSIAPTENETHYRNRIVQGQVHDPNTYAMGGISGHAGLFSTVDDLITVGRAWLFAPATSGTFLNSTTASLFTAQWDHSQSSRAIGWNTNSPDAPDHGWEFSCGTLSARTFMHTGYTGTMMCMDPDRGVGVILLTNRVYPDTTTGPKIHDLRKLFTTKVQQIFDAL